MSKKNKRLKTPPMPEPVSESSSAPEVEPIPEVAPIPEAEPVPLKPVQRGPLTMKAPDGGSTEVYLGERVVGRMDPDFDVEAYVWTVWDLQEDKPVARGKIPFAASMTHRDDMRAQKAADEMYAAAVRHFGGRDLS